MTGSAAQIQSSRLSHTPDEPGSAAPTTHRLTSGSMSPTTIR